jgi:hypothetical protein
MRRHQLVRVREKLPQGTWSGYMALLSGIELRNITEDEAHIAPWDTPYTIRQQEKDGLLPWEVHPDKHEITEQFMKNVEKERERMGLK